MPGRRTVRSGEDARRVARAGAGRVRARRFLAVGRAVGWLVLAGLLGFIGESAGDFRYPDFATVCDPTLPCSPDFEGTLSCCLKFETDVGSRLHVLSGAHFQTCAQANSPTGEMEGLKGRDSVFSQDRAEDPQISVTQITEVDYEAAPRKSVTYNWTRSVFEEVVRRRDELRLMLITALEALKKSRILIEQGLEPDPNGQVWLIIAMQQAEVTRIEMLYNETLGRDVKLFKEHRNEYLAIFPNSDYEKQCDDRLRLTPAAPTRRGAVWYEDQQFVTSGFTTTFKFQLSARNRFCRQKVEARSDQMKGTALTVQLDECLRAVWNSTEWAERVFGIGGGDGFAFVLQGAGPGAMGDRGSDLGYGGIEDSVAIEFDMYDNKEQGDVNDLHVAVHTGGCRKGNSGDSSTRLSSYGGLRTTGRFLQDGDFHYAKIEYTPGVHFNPQSQPLWSSSEYLQQFVKSDGIGTLRVWVGRSLDALSSTSEAVINMPLSIKYAMKLAEGKAYVGFTASTGSMWQNHDILEWEFKQYYPDPILACPPGLVARAQCLAEKRWAEVEGEAIEGYPYFEPGGVPWGPDRGSVCTTCP